MNQRSICNAMGHETPNTLRHWGVQTGPPPSLKARRYQPWHFIPNPAERKLAVIRLHSEGWSITSIAEYMQTSRATVLSEYSVTDEADHKHIEEVKRSHRIETYFRSPQLHLWRLGETEWLLALKQPERKKRKARSAPYHEIMHLRFPDMDEMLGGQAL